MKKITAAAVTVAAIVSLLAGCGLIDGSKVIEAEPSHEARETVRVTLREGLTLEQMFEILERERVASAEDLWEIAENYDFEHEFLEDAPPVGERLRLEGFLFPDTMDYFVDEHPESVIRRMLNNFSNRFTPDMRGQAAEMGYSVRDIVIIASLIEREAAVDDDRPLIASVIYNRLASPDFPRLDIDATILYAMAITGEPFSVNLDSPYNTRRYPGMPPGPIGNPGLRSIRAALEPADTDYYFYALRHDRSHHFTRTYDEHRAFVRSPEYGG